MPSPRSSSSLASIRLDRMLSNYRLERGPRDLAVEAMRFPLMVPLFRGLISSNAGRPPTQLEFARAVAERIGTGLNQAAIMARAGRAYISLVVQYHAYVVLDEHFALVVWDDILDLRYGVDLLVITDDGMPVGLALMAPTTRSIRAANRKQDKTDGLPIVVKRVAVRERAYMAGPFWLYSPSELVSAIEEGASEQRLRVAEHYFEEGYGQRLRDERMGY